MYQDVTYEALLNRMLERALSINSNLDTREGSLLFLGNAPAAVELQNLYVALDTVLNETFADTASREYLILRAAERGLVPFPATPAVLELSITPVSLILPIGTRFSIGELNYSVSSDCGEGKYEIVCETVGEGGNEYSASVIPVEFIKGLETCTITALLIPGEEEEETEAFRRRYLDSLKTQAFGGNRIDYIEKVNAIPGVGGVKVYRVWNSDIRLAEMVPPEGTGTWISGLPDVPASVKSWLDTVFAAASEKKLTVGGSVKVVIIDSTFSVPSTTLVDQVQTVVDPTQNAGEGVGIAPMGHVVKVEGVQAEHIDLSVTLTYEERWEWDDVQRYAIDAINGYFKELAEEWADQDQPGVVRISQIESRLLAVTGILDIADTKINGVAANHTLGPDVIPVLSKITPDTGEKSL